MSHTPGPWKVTPSSSHVFVDNEDRGGVICKMARNGDVLQWACDAASLENTANARLIAAAPELLTALKALLEFAQMYGPSKRASYEDWQEYFEDAEKAIAKAEEKL